MGCWNSTEQTIESKWKSSYFIWIK